MNERDWSDRIAALAVDALLQCGFVQKGDLERAIGVVAGEIRGRLGLGDCPDPESREDEA